MRRARYAAPLLAAVTLVGCGSNVDVELVWGGPAEPGAGGVVSTDGFAAFQESVDEPWERSPATAAAEFLRLDQRKAARTKIESKAEPEGTGSATVVVTLGGVPDDSIEAERWTLGFEEADGVHTITAAIRDTRCRPGRGHQAFSPESCL